MAVANTLSQWPPAVPYGAIRVALSCPCNDSSVRDPADTFKPQAFLSTDATIQPAQMLSWFVRRWTIEATFSEVRRHIGVETQRQWSDKAITRTTPSLLGLRPYPPSGPMRLSQSHHLTQTLQKFRVTPSTAWQALACYAT